MKIAVWRTGHAICDTVAEALAEGFDAPIFATNNLENVNIGAFDAHIAYGILRGADNVFHKCERLGIPWFNCDRGYHNPSHYDGYYRISYRGTQARWHEGIPRKPVDIKLEPRQAKYKHALLCPPTKPVCEFFGVDCDKWVDQATTKATEAGLTPVMRHKEEKQPLIWSGIAAVITFNSSVGWKALQCGIPVLSDPNHSLIGSFYKANSLDLLLENFHSGEDNRLQIFEAMAAHQFRLDEIKQGKAWPLISHYLTFSSVGIAENPSPQVSVSTQLGSAPSSRFRLIT